MEPRAVRLRTIITAAAIAVVLAACGSDGPAANLPSVTIDEGVAAPPTDAPDAPDAPAVTEAPAEPAEPEEPVVTEAPVAPEPNPVVPEADDGIDLLIALLIIGALIAAVALIGAAIAKSRKKTAEPTVVPAGMPATPSPQSSLLSTSQWITDQLSLELMAAPPTDALQRWSVERSRLDNVAIGAQQQFLAGQNPNWQQLAQAMSALAASVDTSLALRAQVPPNAQLISESINVVNSHRAQLHQLIAVLLPTIDR